MPAPIGTKTAQRQGPQTAPSRGDLVGREGLIGELTAVLQAARESQGGAVVLRGSAGIGKSSLLRVARGAGPDPARPACRAQQSTVAAEDTVRLVTKRRWSTRRGRRVVRCHALGLR
jgi:replication-associated recombination protein RarA